MDSLSLQPLGSLRWELFGPGEPLSAHLQLALDEVLLERAISGHRGPCLRFWEWGERALVLGSHQVLANEVDLEAAAELGFTVARRMSGGGTMIVEPGGTITYSLHAPERLVAGLSFADSFAFFDGWVVDCLRALGVPAAYRPLNDIVSPEGKLGGAAQARRRGWVLHHTTIAWDLDPALVPRLIRIGRASVSPRGVRSAEKRVSPLARWLPGERPAAVAALAAWFRERVAAVTPAALEPTELGQARELAAAKYASAGWLDRLH